MFMMWWLLTERSRREGIAGVKGGASRKGFGGSSLRDLKSVLDGDPPLKRWAKVARPCGTRVVSENLSPLRGW
jgi:hypothetical protein